MAASQLIIIEVIFLAFLVGYLIKYYKSSTVTTDVVIVTFIAWSLSFAGTILLPYDMAITLSPNSNSNNASMFPLWEAIYWSTFALAWAILPIQLQYHLSGEFTVTGKIVEAVKSNLQTLLIELALLILFIIYMVSTQGSKATIDFIAFMMAMGNTYGVILIILLMGNGLVALPRRLWQMGNTENEINRLYLVAISVESSFHDARFELEDCETEVQTMFQRFDLPESDPSLLPLAETIKNLVDSFQFALRSTSNKFRSVTSKDIQPICNRKDLVELHARVKRTQLRVAAAERRWKNLLVKVKLFQCLQDGTLKPEESSWCEMKTISSVNPLTRERGGIISSCSREILSCYQYLRLLWRKHLFIWSCRTVAILCGFGSLLIFYSELGMTIGIESPIGAIIVALSTSGAGIFPIQLVSFLCLAYMSLCTYWSLFKMNLGWSYTLHGPHQSPDSSLLFNANYLSRLQFPLGYNFLLFLNSKQIDGTAFQKLMINMEIIPLFGSSFAVYAPLITALIGVITFFNVYARILKSVGIQEEDSVMGADFCHKMTSSEIEEIESGKKLVSGQLRTLGHLIWTNESKDSIGRRDDSVELIGNKTRRSDDDFVETIKSKLRNEQKNPAGDGNGEGDGEDLENQGKGLTFRDKARAFGSNKPAYISLRGSSPGVELDSSNEPDVGSLTSKTAERIISEEDWNLPSTSKKFGRYG